MGKNRLSNEYIKLLQSIGYFLKSQRLKNGQKIFAVASSIGVTHPVISKIENGRYFSLNLRLLFILIEYYKLEIKDIFIYLVNANLEIEPDLVNSKIDKPKHYDEIVKNTYQNE